MITEEIIALALAEDLGPNAEDLTTHSLFLQTMGCECAYIISKEKEPIILAGVLLIQQIFNKIDPSCHIHIHHYDGETINFGEKIITIEGKTHSILKGERISLNFIQHLSAIATLTAKFVDLVKHTQLKILDTRKTTPGMRILEKYAVQCGGGINHRFGLYDAILVKDTHIDMLGGMEFLIPKLPYLKTKNVPVIIEVQCLQDLELLLNHHIYIDRVLLDNMSMQELTESVPMCRDKIFTEASGNINLNNIIAIAETGVDYASIGMLTHSAGNVDLSMKINNAIDEY